MDNFITQTVSFFVSASLTVMAAMLFVATSMGAIWAATKMYYTLIAAVVRMKLEHEPDRLERIVR